jgi:hypothetical protein
MNGEVCAAEVRVLKRVWRRGGGLEWVRLRSWEGLGEGGGRVTVGFVVWAEGAENENLGGIGARVSKEVVGRGGLGGRLFQRIAWMGKGCVSDFE